LLYLAECFYRNHPHLIQTLFTNPLVDDSFVCFDIIDAPNVSLISTMAINLTSSTHIFMSTTSLLSTTTTKHQPTLPTHPTTPLPKSITMALDRRGKVTRNIPLESSLVNLGVSETEVHKLTREEQSAKYNALIQEVASIERFCCLCGGMDLWCQSTGEWYCSRCLE
jgi:hypothetical protein